MYHIDKKMEKYDVNENKILEELSEVTAAKREASMVKRHLIYLMLQRILTIIISSNYMINNLEQRHTLERRREWQRMRNKYTYIELQ